MLLLLNFIQLLPNEPFNKDGLLFVAADCKSFDFVPCLSIKLLIALIKCTFPEQDGVAACSKILISGEFVFFNVVIDRSLKCLQKDLR